MGFDIFRIFLFFPLPFYVCMLSQLIRRLNHYTLYNWWVATAVWFHNAIVLTPSRSSDMGDVRVWKPFLILIFLMMHMISIQGAMGIWYSFSETPNTIRLFDYSFDIWLFLVQRVECRWMRKWTCIRILLLQSRRLPTCSRTRNYFILFLEKCWQCLFWFCLLYMSFCTIWFDSHKGQMARRFQILCSCVVLL